MLRALLAYLPSRSPAALARSLVRRADAMRDARQWLAAAALYEEALAIAPHRHRVHIQCGHAYKEAGFLEQAGDHYGAASEAAPEDADLTLQIGHFRRTCGHLAEAEAAYRRALTLDPGLFEAREALKNLGPEQPAEAGVDGALIPELLPRETPAAIPRRDQIILFQLGREWSRTGAPRRILRGVEAVRAACLASAPIQRVDLVVDGTVVRTTIPTRHALTDPLVPSQAKYVANIWHDFAGHVPGEALVELRFVEADGTARTYRASLLVQPPSGGAERRLSDSYVPQPITTDLDTAIDALPSVCRAGRRLPPIRPPQAILVQRVDQLGDLVASAPALRRLRELFSEARIVGLVSPANAALAETLPWLDEVEVVELGTDPITGARLLAAEAQTELQRRLRRYAFDLAIDLGEGGASRPLLRLSGAPALYGFRPRDFPWLSGGIEADMRDPVNGHEAAPHSHRLLMLVESLAILAGRTPEIVRRAAADPTTLAGLGLGSTDYAVLHTGARLKFSRWPGFAALTRLLLERTDLDVIVMTEAADAPLALPASPRVVTQVGPMPFDRFDGLLAGARVLVGNDSGPKHLAAFRGTPVVSVHSARINWSEWGQEQTGTIVSRRLPCAGCGIAEHPEDCGRDIACIRLIRPEEVLAAVQTLLDAPAPEATIS